MAGVVTLRSCFSLAWQKTKFTRNFDLPDNIDKQTLNRRNEGASPTGQPQPIDRRAAYAASFSERFNAGMAQATPVPARLQ